MKKQSTIFEAACVADIKTIKHHINSGVVDVNEKDPSGRGTALYQVIRSLGLLAQKKSSEQHLEAVALLMAAGALLFRIAKSAVHTEGLVITEAYYREPALFKVLQTANIYLPNLSAALEAFTVFGNVIFVKLLLAKGAEIRNKKDPDFPSYTNTVLSLAIGRLSSDEEPVSLFSKKKLLSPQRRLDYIEIITLLITNGALYFHENPNKHYIESAQTKAQELVKRFPQLSPILKDRGKIYEENITLLANTHVPTSLAAIIASYAGIYSKEIPPLILDKEGQVLNP